MKMVRQIGIPILDDVSSVVWSRLHHIAAAAADE
jgi:hypothetical protein